MNEYVGIRPGFTTEPAPLLVDKQPTLRFLDLVTVHLEVVVEHAASFGHKSARACGIGNDNIGH